MVEKELNRSLCLSLSIFRPSRPCRISENPRVSGSFQTKPDSQQVPVGTTMRPIELVVVEEEEEAVEEEVVVEEEEAVV